MHRYGGNTANTGGNTTTTIFSLNGCFLNSTLEEKYIKGVSHTYRYGGNTAISFCFALNGCFLNSTIEEKYLKGVSHSNICSAGVI